MSIFAGKTLMITGGTGSFFLSFFLSLTINEKDRIKRERKAENEVLMRGFKDTLKQAGKLVG